MLKSIFISILLLLPCFISRKILENFFSFTVINSKISPLNYFNCKSTLIINSNISHFNVFKIENLIIKNSTIRNFNLMKFLWLANFDGAFLGVGNRIYGFKTKSPKTQKQCAFRMGKKSELSGKHFFDVSNSITIGNNVVIGGFNSVFWTHGYDFNRNYKSHPINIGNNVFIGSHCTITHGVKISDNITIGTRSVVTKSLLKSGFYVSTNKILYKSKKEHN